jgi:hypothetical protein
MSDGFVYHLSYEGVEQAAQQLDQIAQAEGRVAQGARQTAAAGEAAGRQARSRSQRLADLRRRLEELHREEVRNERTMASGQQTTEQSTRAAERRRHQIERLSRVIGEEERVQQRASASVRRYAQDTQQATAATADWDARLTAVKATVVGFAAGLIGPAGLQRALAIIRQEIEQNVEASREFSDALLELMFLQETFGQQDREYIGQVAGEAGRSPVEVARVFADIVSRRAQASPQEQRALLDQVLQSGMTTTAPLASLADAMLTIQQMESDPQAAQNILFEGIRQAGVADPGRIAPLFGQFMATGVEVGGLSPGQAAGALAGATGMGMRPSRATTGLTNLVLGISGQGTPQGREIMERAGIDRSEFLPALQQLSDAVQSGAISSEELEQIAGREGLAVTAMLSDPERLRRFMGAVTAVEGAAASPRDLTGERIREVFGADELARLNLIMKQEEAGVEAARSGDVRAMRIAAGRQALERHLIDEGYNPFRRDLQLWWYRAETALGRDPENIFRGLVRTGPADRRHLAIRAALERQEFGGAPGAPAPGTPGAPAPDELLEDLPDAMPGAGPGAGAEQGGGAGGGESHGFAPFQRRFAGVLKRLSGGGGGGGGGGVTVNDNRTINVANQYVRPDPAVEEDERGDY